MNKIFLLLFMVAIAMLAVLPVYAHESVDLGVSNPGILPTNPFYFLKEIRRSIQLLFAFSKEAKLEIELVINNEKAAELKAVVEKNPQKGTALSKALENYQKSRKRLLDRFGELKDISQNPNLEKLIGKAKDQMEKHEALFDDLLEDFEDEINDKTLFNEVSKDLESGLGELEKIEVELMEKNTGDDKLHKKEDDDDDDEAKEDGGDARKVEKIFCAQIYEPVCGVDEKTYSNICFAKAANVKIQHEGDCKK